jgi:hypothetical protein
LSSLEQQELEERPVVVNWDTPLGIVIRAVEFISSAPAAANQVFSHRL